MSKIDIDTLEMALVGNQLQVQKILESIATIEKQLGGRTSKVGASSDGAARKRKPLSKTARKHIHDAQKKRWAAFRAKKPKAAKPRRKMSAATRKKLAANLAKAR